MEVVANPRGIPRAPFVVRLIVDLAYVMDLTGIKGKVEDFVEGPSEVESTLRKFQEMIRLPNLFKLLTIS
jgi:hypothetical protein